MFSHAKQAGQHGKFSTKFKGVGASPPISPSPSSFNSLEIFSLLDLNNSQRSTPPFNPLTTQIPPTFAWSSNTPQVTTRAPSSKKGNP
jgi:hypothetical protein